MSYFINKMKKLGGELKDCFDFAVAPIEWDLDFFKQNRDFAGAFFLLPSLVVACVTSVIAIGISAIHIATTGILGGIVAAAQDGFSFAKRLFERCAKKPTATQTEANNRGYYSATTTQVTRSLGGTPVNLSSSPAPRSPKKPVNPVTETRPILASDRVDMYDPVIGYKR